MSEGDVSQIVARLAAVEERMNDVREEVASLNGQIGLLKFLIPLLLSGVGAISSMVGLALGYGFLR